MGNREPSRHEPDSDSPEPQIPEESAPDAESLEPAPDDSALDATTGRWEPL